MANKSSSLRVSSVVIPLKGKMYELILDVSPNQHRRESSSGGWEMYVLGIICDQGNMFYFHL